MICPVNGLTSNKVVDPRAMLALARTNWLHSHYNIVSPAIILMHSGLAEILVQQ